MAFGKFSRFLFAVAVLGFLFASFGCNGSLQSSTGAKLARPRVDWGMSLLAGGMVGFGEFPAKFTFDVNAVPDCTRDFIAYNSGSAGAPGVAKIVAFNNLYSTQGGTAGLCGSSGPSIYWAYDTDTTGSSQSLTSAVLSVDGSKIAFIDTYASGVLRVLKWKAGQGTGVATPATPDHDISGMNWSTCPAGSSCIASIPFQGSTTDSNSPPFYDYAHDVLYAGDDSGGLHKFTGVFNGTPAEVTTGGWPLEIDSGFRLTGPVYDSVSGNIYVGDSSGVLSMIREVGSTVGTCTAPCVNLTLTVGIGGQLVDAPLVDGTNGYVFEGNGNEMLHGGTLLQASTDFTTSVVSFNVGGSAPPFGANIYHGAFDNAYLNSSRPSVTGHMYICGKDHANIDRPALYQLSFTGDGVLSSVGSALVNLAQANNEQCSPVTEFFNSTTSKDWVFFSIGDNANTGSAVPDPIPAGGCATDGAGCVISVEITGNPSWPPASVTNTASVPANPSGGSSGIVVDNVSASSQASSIYFSLGANSSGTGPGLPSCNTTAGVGCAVKLTQSDLQ